MYKRILVPLDGSKLSEQVLPYVRILGKALGSRIELLRVVPAQLQGQAPSSGALGQRHNVNLHTQSLDYLTGIRESLGNLEVKISCLVEERDPGHCIVREAEKEPDTLIAISTHARLGLGRLVLRSVMDQVLRTANKPLLAVRPWDEDSITQEAEVGLKSIIVPLDRTSPAEEQIVPHVVTLAKALDLTVILITIASVQDEASTRNYLHRVGEQLSQQGVASVQELVHQGHPGDIIVAVARENEDCMVAITTHGRSGVRRLMRREGDTLMLGSIADRVVHNSRAPVLVVRLEG